MEMCRKEYLDFKTYGQDMFPFESPKVFQFPADDEIQSQAKRKRSSKS